MYATNSAGTWSTTTVDSALTFQAWRDTIAVDRQRVPAHQSLDVESQLPEVLHEPDRRLDNGTHRWCRLGQDGHRHRQRESRSHCVQQGWKPDGHNQRDRFMDQHDHWIRPPPFTSRSTARITSTSASAPAVISNMPVTPLAHRRSARWQPVSPQTGIVPSRSIAKTTRTSVITTTAWAI